MKSEDDLTNEAAHHRWMAATLHLAASVHELGASAAEATIGLRRLADALTPLEEWPDVVLEDILDAEVIGA